LSPFTEMSKASDGSPASASEAIAVVLANAHKESDSESAASGSPPRASVGLRAFSTSIAPVSCRNVTCESEDEDSHATDQEHGGHCSHSSSNASRLARRYSVASSATSASTSYSSSAARLSSSAAATSGNGQASASANPLATDLYEKLRNALVGGSAPRIPLP
jgi:hypothetical protein